MAQASKICLVQEETELEMKHCFANMECGTEMRNCKENRQRSESPEEQAALGAAIPWRQRQAVTLTELCLLQITPLPTEANGH